VPSYAACQVQGLAESKDKEPLFACASSYSHSTSKVMAIICILSGSQAWFIMMNGMNLKEKLLLKHAYAFHKCDVVQAL